jgi:hypothetical protein
MDEQTRLTVLLDLAEELGITVRRVPSAAEGADRPGGAFVRLRDREMLFLDPTAAIADQIAVVASSLHGRDQIESRYLPPEIREAIDQAGEAT